MLRGYVVVGAVRASIGDDARNDRTIFNRVSAEEHLVRPPNVGVLLQRSYETARAARIPQSAVGSNVSLDGR